MYGLLGDRRKVGHLFIDIKVPVLIDSFQYRAAHHVFRLHSICSTCHMVIKCKVIIESFNVIIIEYYLLRNRETS